MRVRRKFEFAVRIALRPFFFVIIVFEYFPFSVLKMEGISIVLFYRIDSKICPFKSVIIMRFLSNCFLTLSHDKNSTFYQTLHVGANIIIFVPSRVNKMLKYDSNAKRMMNKLTQHLSHDTICFLQISCAANLISVIPCLLYTSPSPRDA